jgi:4-diphosphocytidyl-2-C-methyl-D-erythritol kinase
MSSTRPKVISGAPTSEFAASPTHLEVHAPATATLAFRVGERDTESEPEIHLCRHSLTAVYCSVGIYDDVEISLKRRGSGFSLDLEGDNLGDLVSDAADMRENLAVQALFALAHHAHRQPNVGIRIFKRIPVAAGLGSAAADAAAVFVGLNRLWNLKYDLDTLRAIAAPLGHGIPFCLTGGLLVGTKYGESVTPITADIARQLGPEMNFTTMLLGTYSQGLSKAAVYEELDRERSEKAGLAAGPDATDQNPYSALHFGSNDLETSIVSLYPRAGAAIEDALAAADGVTAFVSGSGPTVVACLPDSKAMWKVIGAWKASRSVDRIVRVEAPADITLS